MIQTSVRRLLMAFGLALVLGACSSSPLAPSADAPEASQPSYEEAEGNTRSTGHAGSSG